MTSRRKSIGRGDEASGPRASALASQSMARGEPLVDLVNHQYGTPQKGKYTTHLGGTYAASVPNGKA